MTGSNMGSGVQCSPERATRKLMQDTQKPGDFSVVRKKQDLPSRKDRVQKCVDDMRAAGITYSAFFPNAFFEERLFMKETDKLFSLDISRIRKALLHYGFYITCRGQKRKGYIVHPAHRNADIMRSASKQAVENLKNGTILGTNTPMSCLSQREQERHEAMLRKIVWQQCKLEREKSVEQLVRTKRPDLIEYAEEP